MSGPDKVYGRLGGDAQWFRHILYGLAGETPEAQRALDAWETAHAHELGEKVRQRVEGELRMILPEFRDAVWQGMHRAADIVDPDGAE